jgi:hypothetical protein
MLIPDIAIMLFETLRNRPTNRRAIPSCDESPA